VPQDRLRKLTDDNRELAANLRREATAAAQPKVPPKTLSKSRRGGQGSEIGSGRGSEERNSSVPAGPNRGAKRARDNDIEKVRPTDPFLTRTACVVSALSIDLPEGSSPLNNCLDLLFLTRDWTSLRCTPGSKDLDTVETPVQATETTLDATAQLDNLKKILTYKSWTKATGI
jgi:hypothetical protein